jgi:hypothetical protein
MAPVLGKRRRAAAPAASSSSWGQPSLEQRRPAIAAAGKMVKEHRFLVTLTHPERIAPVRSAAARGRFRTEREGQRSDEASTTATARRVNSAEALTVYNQPNRV